MLFMFKVIKVGEVIYLFYQYFHFKKDTNLIVLYFKHSVVCSLCKNETYFQT